MRISSVLVFGLMGAGLVTLSACEPEVKAPASDDVCYFIGHIGKDKNGHDTLKFNPVAKVPDLDHCAAEIYKVRRGFMATGTAGDVTEGVYNGNYLFAAKGEVRKANSYNGPQFPFMVVRGDRLMSPSDAYVEDAPTETKPETVTVPKDLPKAPDAPAAKPKP